MPLAEMSANLITNLVMDVLHSCQAISTEVAAGSHPESEDRSLIGDHVLRATAERQLMLKLGELGCLVR